MCVEQVAIHHPEEAEKGDEEDGEVAATHFPEGNGANKMGKVSVSSTFHVLWIGKQSKDATLNAASACVRCNI